MAQKRYSAGEIVVEAEDQIALPVAGHRSVLGLRRAFADHEVLTSRGRRLARFLVRLGKQCRIELTFLDAVVDEVDDEEGRPQRGHGEPGDGGDQPSPELHAGSSVSRR